MLPRLTLAATDPEPAQPRGNPLADARRELKEVKERLARIQAAADAALSSAQEFAMRGRAFYTRPAQAGSPVDPLPAVKAFSHIDRVASEALRNIRR